MPEYVGAEAGCKWVTFHPSWRRTFTSDWEWRERNAIHSEPQAESCCQLKNKIIKLFSRTFMTGWFGIRMWVADSPSGPRLEGLHSWYRDGIWYGLYGLFIIFVWNTNISIESWPSSHLNLKCTNPALLQSTRASQITLAPITKTNII